MKFIKESLSGRNKNRKYTYEFASKLSDEIFENLIAINPTTRRTDGYLPPQHTHLRDEVLHYCKSQGFPCEYKKQESRTDYYEGNIEHYTCSIKESYIIGPLSDSKAIMLCILFGQHIVRDTRLKDRQAAKDRKDELLAKIRGRLRDGA